MLESSQERASAQINLLARRKRWPLICDAHLRFVTPQLKTALEVWTSKRDGRAMPSRSNMTLPELRATLPNLAFLRIVRKGAHIRLQAKLIGSELDRFLGGPMTGRFVDEALPAASQKNGSLYGCRHWRLAFRHAPSDGSNLPTSGTM